MATTEEIRTDLADIVNEVAGIDADDVQLDKSFVDDLDVDSLSMVEVVVAAEEKFDVKIPDDEVKNLKTVGDAVAYIEAHRAEVEREYRAVLETAEENRRYWQERNQDRLAPVGSSPARTEEAEVRAKLQAWKAKQGPR